MKKIKISNVFYLLHLIWQICKGQLIWNGIISFLSSIESFIFNVMFIKIIVGVLVNHGEMNDIILICIILFIMRIIIGYLKSIYGKKYAVLYDIEISETIKKRLFEKICILKVEYCESKDFQSKYYKMMEKIDNTIHLMTDNFFQLVGHLLSMIFILVYVCSVDPLLIILMAIPMISSKAMKASASKRYAYDMEIMEFKRRQDYVNRVVYLKEYALELRMTDIFKVLVEQFDKAGIEIKEKINQYGLILGILRVVSDFIMTTTSLFIAYLYMGWRFFFLNNVKVEDFAVIISAINNMNGKLSSILRNIYNLQENSLYVQQLRDFFEDDVNRVELKDHFYPDYNVFKQIEVKDISYRYFSGNKNVIDDICFSIKEKEKIAIVGPNGSGKSTLIKVLAALYEQKNGTILIDGKDLRSFGVNNYKKLFCIVFQDFKAYAMSIKDNVSMGEDIDDEKIIKALEAVGLKEEIMGLEKQLDTILTKETDEAGVVLSGGQLQRLLVSRAFVTNAPIIILDEPTAALDAESEKNIYDCIYNMLPQKTVIFVTHRLTGTIKADKIIMFEEGKNIEFGTHRELMEKKGRYYEMFNTQAKVYLANGGAL